MIYAVISDLHANESALRHVLKDATAAGAEHIACLGDIVGYGPMPRETLALIRKTAATVIAGNHDDAVCGRQGADDFIDLAGDAISRHRAALSEKDLDYLRSLPYQCRIGDAVAVHGDFSNPRQFNYVESEADAAASFNAVEPQLLFVGHTHTPAIYVTGQSGTVYQLPPQDFTLEPGKRYLVNPGSVGYPRATDGRCCSSYVIYDTVRQSVSFREVPFSVASVMQRGGVRRLRWLWPAAIGLAILAAGAGIVLYKAAHPQQVKIIEAGEVRNLTIDRKSLTLGNDARFVRANLKVDGRCDPLMMRVEFKSASGELTGETERTVKESSCERIRVPSDSLSAHFTLTQRHPEDKPKVITFAPEVIK